MQCARIYVFFLSFLLLCEYELPIHFSGSAISHSSNEQCVIDEGKRKAHSLVEWHMIVRCVGVVLPFSFVLSLFLSHSHYLLLCFICVVFRCKLLFALVFVSHFALLLVSCVVFCFDDSYLEFSIVLIHFHTHYYQNMA